MKLKFYKPKSEFLEKYVQGYYFTQRNKGSEPLHYLTFPNNYTIVTVMQNVSFSQINNRMKIKPSEKDEIFANMVYRYTSPIEILYEEPVNEITIYFKPLGINFFVENPGLFFCSGPYQSDQVQSF